MIDSNDPETLSRLECKGGNGNVNDEYNLPNEITDENTIEVRGGSKDVQSLKPFQIQYSCVHHEFDINLIRVEYKDIGLLKTSINPGDGNYFYPRRNKLRHFDIGPICLPVEDAQLENTKIEMVGWGALYEEYHADGNRNNDPVQNAHSCTTTRFGPRLQTHCDVDYLRTQNWGCHMTRESSSTFITFLEDNFQLSNQEANDYVQEHEGKYYPPGYDAEICAKYWNKADLIMNSKVKQDEISGIQNIWKQTYGIEIGQDKRNAKNKEDFEFLKGCYNPDLFETNGWCFVAGEVYTKQWGFAIRLAK